MRSLCARHDISLGRYVAVLVFLRKAQYGLSIGKQTGTVQVVGGSEALLCMLEPKAAIC